jgi:hypothetical protein
LMDDLGRTRTRSSTKAAAGLYEVGPEPAYEYEGHEDEQDQNEEVDENAMLEGEGSQEGEHEDSVGLLSKTPSHQGSLANLRQRASSLSNSIHRLRTRSQGASSQSNSNSGSGSAEVRSRTRSLAAQQRPESHAMSSLGSGSRSRSHSRSRTSSLVPVIGARYTSQRPTEFGVTREVGTCTGGGGSYQQQSRESDREMQLPPVPLIPESIARQTGNRARAESSAPSERTIQQPGSVRLAAHPNLSIEHPDISEAHE